MPGIPLDIALMAIVSSSCFTAISTVLYVLFANETSNSFFTIIEILSSSLISKERLKALSNLKISS